MSKMDERCSPVLLVLLRLWAEGSALGKATRGVKQKILQYVVIHLDILYHMGFFYFILKIGALPLSGEEEGAGGQRERMTRYI